MIRIFFRTNSIGSRGGSFKRNNVKPRGIIDDAIQPIFNSSAVQFSSANASSPVSPLSINFYKDSASAFFRESSIERRGSVKHSPSTTQLSSGVVATLHHSASGPSAMHAHVSPRNSAYSAVNVHKSPLSPKTSSINIAAQPPTSTATSGSISFPFYSKSKFKMAHESFRIRMFQEQYGFEPVRFVLQILCYK